MEDTECIELNGFPQHLSLCVPLCVFQLLSCFFCYRVLFLVFVSHVVKLFPGLFLGSWILPVPPFY